ncbi:MAG TPA: hypothetical protein PKY41_08575 [Bacteroidales bacterium]|nr:hypothetical protein [Bacteroidales bacterium]
MLLCLVFLYFTIYSQNIYTKKGIWEINGGYDINVPKVSNYNYIQFIGTDPSYAPYNSYIDVNVKPITVKTPYINLCGNFLIHNFNDKNIFRLGIGAFYYQRNYQFTYSGKDITRYTVYFPSIPDSAIHIGKEAYNMNNFGINFSFIHYYKLAKIGFLFNKLEVNFANPYIYHHKFSDTSRYVNGKVSITNFYGYKGIHTMIGFPLPTMTLNYYLGFSFILFPNLSITPNIGMLLLRKDFDNKRHIHYWDQDLFNEGTYQINKHYLFMRGGITLNFTFN